MGVIAPILEEQQQKQQMSQQQQHQQQKQQQMQQQQEQINEKKKPHIKKPLNAFMLYMKEMRAKVVAECTLKESAAINQILGRRVSTMFTHTHTNRSFQSILCSSHIFDVYFISVEAPLVISNSIHPPSSLLLLLSSYLYTIHYLNFIYFSFQSI